MRQGPWCGATLGWSARPLGALFEHDCCLEAGHVEKHHVCMCSATWLDAEQPLPDRPPVGVNGTIKRPRPTRALEAGP